ncbi:MAG: hypothetical protein GOV15_00460, partial [Candidatus Diapherotrites archaeon]|nr:hypothetical protein [Candidatus Diapherotrites archaeon]
MVVKKPSSNLWIQGYLQSKSGDATKVLHGAVKDVFESSERPGKLVSSTPKRGGGHVLEYGFPN